VSSIDIPDPLPPAITPDREVIEFFIEQDLEEFGQDSLVARTWQWVLHGGGPGPISHMDWSRFDGDGPPSAATLAAESTASPPPLHPPTSWDELNRARFSCWYAQPSPKTSYPYGSTPGMSSPHQPPPKKARSPSPCAKPPATDRPTAPAAKAFQSRYRLPLAAGFARRAPHSRSLLTSHLGDSRGARHDHQK
jgi:hypothetical protein